MTFLTWFCRFVLVQFHINAKWFNTFHSFRNPLDHSGTALAGHYYFENNSLRRHGYRRGIEEKKKSDVLEIGLEVNINTASAVFSKVGIEMQCDLWLNTWIWFKGNRMYVIGIGMYMWNVLNVQSLESLFMYIRWNMDIIGWFSVIERWMKYLDQWMKVWL